MTNEELVAQIQAGQKELMPDLWEAVSGFVAQQARKAAGRWDAVNDTKGYEAYGDFYGTGYLAVYDAAQTYDPERGASFLTHLNEYLKKHFGQARADMTGWKRHAYDVLRKRGTAVVRSLNQRRYGEDSEDETEIIDTLADTDDPYESLSERWYIQDLHNILERMLDRLPPQLADMVRKKYYEGMTLSEIGDAYGITPQRVSAKLDQAMWELRRQARRSEMRRALEVYIDTRTDFYRHVGLSRFQNTGTSSVEAIAMQRENMRQELARIEDRAEKELQRMREESRRLHEELQRKMAWYEAEERRYDEETQRIVDARRASGAS